MYCGQTAGWMKMPLDTQLGLGPGHIVKDATQLPQKGNNSPPIFSPCIVAKRVDGSTCHLIRRYRPRPRRNYVRWGPAPPKGHISRIFGPCLLWPRSPISATAELLFDLLSHRACVANPVQLSPAVSDIVPERTVSFTALNRLCRKEISL